MYKHIYLLTVCACVGEQDSWVVILVLRAYIISMMYAFKPDLKHAWQICSTNLHNWKH